MDAQKRRPHTAVIEFVCTDCGAFVYEFGNPPAPLTRCATCTMLHDIADPVERALMREALRGT